MFHKTTGNLTFFLTKIDLSVFSNTYEFFQIFFWSSKVFFSSEKTLKSHGIWICFRKKDYALHSLNFWIIDRIDSKYDSLSNIFW